MVDGRAEINLVDLARQPAPLLLQDNLNALTKKFKGDALNEVEQQAVASADRFLQQLLDADFIVVACPMYNFSLAVLEGTWNYRLQK